MNEKQYCGFTVHVIHNHPYFSWYVDYLHMHINVCAGACAACFIGTVNVFLSGVCVCVCQRGLGYLYRCDEYVPGEHSKAER